jgi:hypothetical protein
MQEEFDVIVLHTWPSGALADDSFDALTMWSPPTQSIVPYPPPLEERNHCRVPLNGTLPARRTSNTDRASGRNL